MNTLTLEKHCWAEIDLTALRENYEYIRRTVGGPVCAVVKADAYGHGDNVIARVLQEAGAAGFAVSSLGEGRHLRRGGITTPILILGYADPTYAAVLAANDLITTCYSTEYAQALSAAAVKAGVKVKVHLKIDTGMGRYGFLPSQVAEAIACYDLPNLEFTGAYTHFSSAFHDKAKTIAQLEVFKDTLAQIEKAGKTVGIRHAANSPALLNVEHVALDAVRIGSAFTGRVITHSKTPLHRLGRLEAEVVDIKEVPAGYAVGYNGTFVTKHPTTIAIVPMGHYDGFGLTKEKENHNFHSVLSALKQFLKKAHLTVTINGKAYPVIGEVGLSHTAVDVTGSSVQPGDIATCDLSPLLVNPRVPRVYTE